MSEEEYILHEMEPKYDELKQLLESWKLSHLYAYFYEQKRTPQLLQKLQPHHIEKLFKDVALGDQVQFKDCFKKWNPKKFEQVGIKNCNEIISHPIKLSVTTILDKCANGSYLKKYFDLHGHFTEHQRGTLVNSLATYIHTNKIPFTLSDCANLEKQISLVFPGEKMEYYSNGKRGRLYNKLSNLRRLVKDIPTKDNVEECDAPLFRPEDDAEEIVAQMRCDGISAEVKERLWTKCTQYRLGKIQDSSSTQEILKDWPEYKQIHGFRFVALDFDVKYQSEQSLVKNWAHQKPKILKYLKAKVSNSFVSNLLHRLPSFDPGTEDFILLWALHNIFCPTPIVINGPNGQKLRKKFTISDSQDAFALIAVSMEDLNTKLKFLQLKGEPMQPRILVIGDITKVKEIFIHFDGIKYTFLNIIDAADVLFKIFFVFNLKFPDPALVFYKFFETFFYGMKGSRSSKIQSIISDIKKL